MVRTLITLVVALSAVVAGLWLLQRRLIYLPLGTHVPAASAVLPRASQVELFTEDGLRLWGWFLPPAGRGDGAAVIVFNGNAGHRAHRSSLAEALSESGLSVLLFDYRGYGGNPGRPSERGLAMDARAAVSGLVSQPGVDPERIVYFGESLGAAVALGLAQEVPPAALVLRSPFTSLADVGALHYPYLPVRLLLRDRYPSFERIGALDAPVLVVAGSEDGIVPPSQSRRVYQAAAGPKRLVVIPGAGHNDPELLAGERLVGEVLRFLEENGITSGR